MSNVMIQDAKRMLLPCALVGLLAGPALTEPLAGDGRLDDNRNCGCTVRRGYGSFFGSARRYRTVEA